MSLITTSTYQISFLTSAIIGLHPYNYRRRLSISADITHKEKARDRFAGLFLMTVSHCSIASGFPSDLVCAVQSAAFAVRPRRLRSNALTAYDLALPRRVGSPCAACAAIRTSVGNYGTQALR